MVIVIGVNILRRQGTFQHKSLQAETIIFCPSMIHRPTHELNTSTQDSHEDTDSCVMITQINVLNYNEFMIYIYLVHTLHGHVVISPCYPKTDEFI